VSQEIFLRFIVLALAVATLVGSAVLFSLNSNIGGTAFATVFVILLIFVFLGRFKKFKGFGIEAELWEEKLQQAAQLTDQLSKLRLLLTGELMSLSVRVGRWGPGFSWKERIQLRDQLRSIFQSDPSAKSLFEQIDGEIGTYIALDYFIRCTKQFNENVQKCRRAESEQINKEFGSPVKDSVGYGAKLNVWREKSKFLHILDEPKKLAEDFKLGEQWSVVFEQAYSMWGERVLEHMGPVDGYRRVIGVLQKFETQKYRADDLIVRMVQTLTESELG
jgi:hypothetical protein